MFSFKAIAVLSTAGVALAAGNSYSRPGKSYTATKDSSDDVALTTQIKLGNGVFWTEKGDFGKAHARTEKYGLGKKCEELKDGEQKIEACLEIRSAKYTWGEKKVLKKNVKCSKPPCTINVSKPFEGGMSFGMNGNGGKTAKEGNLFNGPFPFLPEELWAKPQTLNSSRTFVINEKVNGDKSLWFKPIKFRGSGVLSNKVLGSYKPEVYSNNIHMDLPLKTSSNTLDGIYGLE